MRPCSVLDGSHENPYGGSDCGSERQEPRHVGNASWLPPGFGWEVAAGLIRWLSGRARRKEGGAGLTDLPT